MLLLKEILILLAAVGVSVVLASLTRIPTALLQIACGLLLAPVVQATTITDPDFFFLLFVAPLLFVDAYLAPRKQLLQVKAAIAWMAIGLVLFTVLLGGYLFHWMIVGMPLSLCFALAAILSPTDAVALSSSLRGVRVYEPLARILEGEALLNDATALVCFRVALLAAVTGSFSWMGALSSFAVVGTGGVVIGTAIALAMVQVELWIQRSVGPQPSSQVLLGLLLPFGTYLLAEHLHCSGILAAVTAGLVLAWRVRERIVPETRAHGIQVFEMVQTTMNGLIFVFLGARLPLIAHGLNQHVMPSFGRCCFYVLGSFLLLTALRILWAFPVFTLTSATHGLGERRVSQVGVLGFFGVAGVRGALTLATVLSLPLFTSSGSPLPDRELAVVLATGVILLSLVTAPLLLPRLAAVIQKKASSSHSAANPFTTESGVPEGLLTP